MAGVARDPNLIVSYMGADHILVHQISTGGGLNLTFEEARKLIKLLAEVLPLIEEFEK
jgi:hypothetical protein